MDKRTSNTLVTGNSTYSFRDIMGPPVSAETALDMIKSDANAYRTFSDFAPDHQKRILSFICGSQGLPISYDVFFQHIFNPYLHKERLEKFLSAIFQEDLKIIEVLPREGMRLSADASLVIFDIAVKLSNGSFFDLEMQKVGYYFPGERCSCYTSDFIMRQYAKLKADFKEPNFNFRKMKPIHIITLMEHSSKEFREVSPSYIHKKIQYMDSGAKINFLENTTYISLDTFHEVVHNITTELDACLTFLSSDAPADIVKLVNAYPEFAEYYKEICEFRTNPKELITMYSEALAIMDRNTVMYMCEDMKNTIKQQEETIAKNMAKIAETESALAEKNASLAEKDASLAERDASLAERDATLAERDATLAEQNRIIEELKAQLAQYQS